MPDSWAEDVFEGALQLIAEGLAAAAGFGVAFVQVADQEGVLHIASVGGLDDARVQLSDYRGQVSVVAERERDAEPHGLFRFIREEDFPSDEWLAWEPKIDVLDHPDAWRPRDLLFAPLRNDDGDIVAVLWVDVPTDGLRSDPARFELLDKYAHSTRRAVLVVLANRALDEQVRLAEAARFVVRNVSAEESLDRLLTLAQEPLGDGLRVHSTWILTFDEDGEGASNGYGTAGSLLEVLNEPTAVRLRPVLERLWIEQEVLVFTGEFDEDSLLSELHQRQITTYLNEVGVESVALVPLGVGRECLGGLLLARVQGVGDWTPVELDAARDIGQDIGRALANNRNRVLQDRLVWELRHLDEYKSRLIATVAHELKNPLTSVSGHLEMLDAKAHEDDVRHGLDAIERGTRRMQGVVDNLLLLAEASDESHVAQRVAVEIGQVITAAVQDLAVTAERSDLSCQTILPSEPVWLTADPSDLDRVITNLVSNAMKYSNPGGVVTVTLTDDESPAGRGWVELAVADTGIGISEADRQRLFEEFFRSTNPDAMQRPGTGLGLAIVRRIVERQGGNIRVDSELGLGTRVVVYLPKNPS